MKKLLYTLCAALMLAGATSCSDISPLSASSAKKALKKESFFQKNSCVTSFYTGYYEASESRLDDLAKLKAAGVVNYTTEEINEYISERKWVGNWFYGSYQTVEKTVPHTFVSVQLTEAGQKYVIDEKDIPHGRTDIIKDLKANKDWEEEIPEYMSATHSDKAAEEEAVEEAVEEEVVVEEIEPVIEDSAVVEAEEIVEAAPAPAPAPKVENKNAAYESALERVNEEQVYVLAGRFELVKCKEVRCSKDMLDAGRGSCTVIYKLAEATPFGYVIRGLSGVGRLETANVDFTYYNDLGWIATDIDK